MLMRAVDLTAMLWVLATAIGAFYRTCIAANGSQIETFSDAVVLAYFGLLMLPRTAVDLLPYVPIVFVVLLCIAWSVGRSDKVKTGLSKEADHGDNSTVP